MQILLYAISILSLVIGIDNETKHVSKANSITASLVYHQLPLLEKQLLESAKNPR
jgi:hypothetical protein